MASSFKTLPSIATTGAAVQVFPGQQPQAMVVYVSAIGGAVTVGDVNVTATRGTVIPSGTTQIFSDYDNILGLEGMYVWVAAGQASIMYLQQVPS